MTTINVFLNARIRRILTELQSEIFIGSAIGSDLMISERRWKIKKIITSTLPYTGN